MMETFKASTIGPFKRYSFCRFCNSKRLIPIINLGLVPLAGGFLKSKKMFTKEKFFPLEISFCKKCFLVQSVNVIDKDKLFQNYFYHSSAIKTLTSHFKNVANEILSMKNSNKFFAVEIGSNDGVLIKELKKRKINSLGIDPAKNIVQPLIKSGLPIINDYFSEILGKKIMTKYGKADVICSFNTMAHIENMHDIAKGVKKLLKEDGVLMFETHYLGSLIKKTQYDMIYHEHQYYYSLITLINFFDKYDMEIFDIKQNNIHSGSMRYYVQNKRGGRRKISKNVVLQSKKEIQLGLNDENIYFKFNKKIERTKKNLLSILAKLKTENKRIFGYGASGRGTIVMNYCGLGKYLNLVIDDAKAKQGNYIPGVHLKIIDSKILYSKQRPDYIIIFAWAFLNEIMSKNKEYINNGGKFILPLPHVKIISR